MAVRLDDFAREAITASAGHIDIEDADLGLEPVDSLHDEGAVGDRVSNVALIDQDGGQRLYRVLVVVCDEDADGLARARCGFGCCVHRAREYPLAPRANVGETVIFAPSARGAFAFRACPGRLLWHAGRGCGTARRHEPHRGPDAAAL